MNRRKFFFASSGAAVGSILVPGITLSQGNESSHYPGSGLITGTPKPLRYAEVPGFLSTAQITPHHTAHYGGALKAFNGAEKTLEESITAGTVIEAAAFETLKRLQSSRGNSVILHEYYFDGLALKTAERPADIRRAIEQRFGSIEKWAADFVSSAKAAAGWAVLVLHPVNGKLYNVVSDEHAQGPLWLSAPLVVLDTYEHAYYVDYQNRKAEYVEKFLDFMDWAEVNRRYQLAVKS